MQQVSNITRFVKDPDKLLDNYTIHANKRPTAKVQQLLDAADQIDSLRELVDHAQELSRRLPVINSYKTV